MRGEAEPETDGREGLKSLELLIAALPGRARTARRYRCRWSTDVDGVSIHPSAIVDEGAQIGEGSRVWHWVHVCGGARIGKRRIASDRDVFVGNKVTIGDRCKIQNNVSVYDNVTLEEGVFCGPSMVFTNVTTRAP